MSKLATSKIKAREYAAQVEKESPKLKVFMYFWSKIFDCTYSVSVSSTVGTAAETESDPPQKNHFETFFSFFFHILPIAKWFGSQVSAIVVQFLLRSSFFKLFSQKFWYFTDKNQNTTVWATGRMVSLGSCHILFLQLNWHSYSMGSNPIDAVINLFWHEFILFWSFSCEVIQISLFHVQWSL